MSPDARGVVSMGELVAAVFDAAAESSTNSKDVPRIAAETLSYMINGRSKEMWSLIFPSVHEPSGARGGTQSSGHWVTV